MEKKTATASNSLSLSLSRACECVSEHTREKKMYNVINVRVQAIKTLQLFAQERSIASS